MYVINADNVNGALRHASMLIRNNSGAFTPLASRGGKEVREWHCAVTTVYDNPWRMVLFDPVRDANPFFHMMEAIWMLDGRRDAVWVGQFSSRVAQYAEDDGNFHGAYGGRWRYHFEDFDNNTLSIDQLTEIIDLLLTDTNTRRAVLSMWDPSVDLGVLASGKRDLPCNTHIYFKLREGKLNMTVCCRSNDIVLGCYGANAVQFGMLHAFMSAAIGVMQGRYTQVSDSWHYYVDNPYVTKLVSLPYPPPLVDYYFPGHTGTTQVVNSSYTSWLHDARVFTESDDWNDGTQYADSFFVNVAVPMRDAHAIYKRGDIDSALTRCRQIHTPDWRRACVEWIQRRVA